MISPPPHCTIEEVIKAATTHLHDRKFTAEHVPHAETLVHRETERLIELACGGMLVESLITTEEHHDK